MIDRKLYKLGLGLGWLWYLGLCIGSLYFNLDITYVHAAGIASCFALGDYSLRGSGQSLSFDLFFLFACALPSVVVTAFLGSGTWLGVLIVFCLSLAVCLVRCAWSTRASAAERSGI